MGIDSLAFCVGGWNRLFSCVRAENDLDLVRGIKIDLTVVWVLEFDLDFVCGSKMASFTCGGSKRTWFFVQEMVEVNLIFVFDRKRLGFECGDRFTCFLWGRSKLTYSLCGWSELTWVLCAGRAGNDSSL